MVGKSKTLREKVFLLNSVKKQHIKLKIIFIFLLLQSYEELMLNYIFFYVV
jgi:hypothetical protein